jgi:hypothetical protein
MIATQPELYPTRHCNTGSDSQTEFSVSIDWLRLAIRDSSAKFHEVIEKISVFFSCEMEICLNHFTQHFQKWHGSARSATGIYCQWQNLTQDSDFRFRLEIPGKVCASLEESQLRLFCSLLTDEYDYVTCKRIDIALDDFTKSLWDFDELTRISNSQHYAYVKSSKFVVSTSSNNVQSTTVYFGSRQSDILYRFYQKDLESHGLIDSYRLELQIGDEKANLAYKKWLSLPESETSDYLLSLISGNITFVDRTSQDPNIERLPVYYFWQEICSLSASRTKLPSPRKVPTVERTADWLLRNSAAIYTAILALGNQLYEEILHEGMARFTYHHNCLLATYRLQQNC